MLEAASEHGNPVEAESQQVADRGISEEAGAEVYQSAYRTALVLRYEENLAYE